MNQKKLAFVLAATNNLLFAAANTAISLNKYFTACPFDIILFSDDISESDREALESIDNVSVRRFDVETYRETVLKNCSEDSRFVRNEKHLMALAHFEVFSLLDTYKKTAWLDIDMLVQRNLNEIVDFQGLVMTEDYPWTVGDNFLQPVPGFNMRTPSVCSAFIVVDDSVGNHREIYEWCHEAVVRHAALLKLGDQPIFNLALQNFSLRPTLVPTEIWQCMPERETAIMARVVHFGGDEKIWKSEALLALFSEWYRNHLEWLNLGGGGAEVSLSVCLPFRELKEREMLLEASDHFKEKLRSQDMMDRLIHIEDKVNTLLARE
ncbi:glycosyltransferase [Asaia astilbis]